MAARLPAADRSGQIPHRGNVAAMSVSVPFPRSQPPGYEWFDDEPTFDPSTHLAIEEPDEIIMLEELGYREDEIATKATAVAASSPFRVLSEEGAAIMLDIARRLRPFANRAGDRVDRAVRGGCHRSRWFRDLCVSPQLTEAMAAIYGVDVAPHAMPVHLGHLNFEPERLETPVDRWHHDTLPLDNVMMVTDPATFAGGRFEWFRGTKHEMAEMAARGESPPRDRVEVPEFPAAGYAIALHGDMVVHRGAPLDAPGERITMVNGYVAMDRLVDEQSRNQDLIVVDDHTVLFPEWAKHVAWRAAGRLEHLLAELPYGTSATEVRARLTEAIVDVQNAIDQMHPEREPAPTFHYEQAVPRPESGPQTGSTA